MDTENLTLKEKMDKILDAMEEKEEEKTKRKKIKIPRKAKVKKRRIKKGWVGMLRIDENGNIIAEKVKIEGSSYQDKMGKYHSSNGSEILFWEGKFPILIQETKRNNPVKFNTDENQTYGQEYIMARMMNDTIKSKKAGGGFILWILGIGAAIYAMTQFL